MESKHHKKKEDSKKQLTKTDSTRKKIGVETKSLVTICNKVEDNIKYNLDYQFYIKLCKDTIELISPAYVQISLF